MSFRIEVHWEWSGAIVSDGEQSLRVFTMLLGALDRVQGAL